MILQIQGNHSQKILPRVLQLLAYLCPSVRPSVRPSPVRPSVRPSVRPCMVHECILLFCRNLSEDGFSHILVIPVVCVYVCVHACVHVRACACVCVFHI